MSIPKCPRTPTRIFPRDRRRTVLGWSADAVVLLERSRRKLPFNIFSHELTRSTNSCDCEQVSGMAHNRPAKRQRIGVGGAHRDPIPFADDFSTVHAREARVVRVGKESLSVPTERLVLREADEAWNSAVSWLPVDDPQYALDPNGEWYDETLEGGVMEGFDDHSATAAAKGKKRIRSGVSVRPSARIMTLELIFYSVGLMFFGRMFTARLTWRR